MQVSEQHLVFPEHCAFGQLRFFHLDDQIGNVEDFLRGAENLCAGFFVVGVEHANAVAGIGFYEYFVAIMDEFTNARRRHADAEFECLDFFWYPDSHCFTPRLLSHGDTIRR